MLVVIDRIELIGNDEQLSLLLISIKNTVGSGLREKLIIVVTIRLILGTVQKRTH
jgi:hypothetical protein